MGNKRNKKGESIYMSKKVTAEVDETSIASEFSDDTLAVETENSVVSKSENDVVVIENTKKITVVYVGPTIAGVVKQNTFFNNGIPSILRTTIDEYPALGGLLIPISRLPKALKDITNNQGALHIIFENAKQYKPRKGA